MHRVIAFIIQLAVKTPTQDFDTKPGVKAIEALANNALNDGLFLSTDDVRADVDLLGVLALPYPDVTYSLEQVGAIAVQETSPEEPLVSCDYEMTRTLIASANEFEVAARQLAALAKISAYLRDHGGLRKCTQQTNANKRIAGSLSPDVAIFVRKILVESRLYADKARD